MVEAYWLVLKSRIKYHNYCHWNHLKIKSEDSPLVWKASGTKNRQAAHKFIMAGDTKIWVPRQLPVS